MSDTDRPATGIALRILSGFLGTGMYVSVKAASTSVPLGEIVFFRSFFALIPLIVFLWLRGEFPGGLATKRPGAHLLRSAFGALALFASFAAITRLNLAEAVLIAQLSPILMAIAAVVLLSERLTLGRITGLLFGFAGVLMLVWPELHAETLDRRRLLGFGIAFAAAILSALALIMVRDLNKTESPGAIALYFVLASMLGTLLTVPSGWTMPDAGTLVLLIATGLFGGFAHIAMTLAFRFTEASRLAPFEYLALLWPVLADLLIFGLPISQIFMIAALFILLGAVAASFEQR